MNYGFTGVNATRQAHREPPLAGVQILLVEDELDIANLLMFILHEAGADIVWSVRSAEALAQLELFHPDILLCNVKLPDHDGDWLIEKVRQAESGQTHHLPAIAITSYLREVTAKRMLEAGFDRFLPKHFDEEQLVSSILDLI